MRYYSRDGLTFDVVDSHDGLDPVDTEVAVLLHGWPQDHRTWDAVTPLLVEGGLRTVAPDLRGYSPGARPPRVQDYVMPEMVADVLALIDELGAERVHLVGHDWGGALAWSFAQRHPERLVSLTVVSTPHPAAMAWAFRHADQARRSAYMVPLALPVIAPAVLRRTTGTLLRRTGLPEPLVDQYAERMARPGAAQGSLRWYQAAMLPLRQMVMGRGRRPSTKGDRPAPAVVPTTYVWGRRDPVFGSAVVGRTEHVLTRAAEKAGVDPVEAFRSVGVDTNHWVPETEPAVVAEAVLARVSS